MIGIPQLCFAALLCLCLSGMLSAAETALKSAGRAKLQRLIDQSSALAPLAKWVLENPSQARLTIQTADTLMNIAVAMAVAACCSELFGFWAIIGGWAVATALVIIWGELIPRCVGILLGERCFPVALPLLRGWGWLLAPFVRPLAPFVFAGPLELDGALVTREEIERLVKNSEDSGVLEETERKMIHGVISFEETRVSEIMVPRTDMDLLAADMAIADAMPLIQEWEHSRIPVYKETPDEITGILYVKDLISQLYRGQGSKPVGEMVRKALFVPETMGAADLFETMQKNRIHLAVVVDEYGGTAGIVSLEDVLEKIVGEIQDEYDEEEPDVVPIDENTWRVRASIALDDLSEALNYPFHGDDVENVAGYILELSRDFPKKGDCLIDGPWSITVTSVKKHRINEATFRRLESPEEQDLSGTAAGEVSLS